MYNKQLSAFPDLLKTGNAEDFYAKSLNHIHFIIRIKSPFSSSILSYISI